MGVRSMIRAFSFLALSAVVLFLMVTLHNRSMVVDERVFRPPVVPMDGATPSLTQGTDQLYQTWQQGLVTEVRPSISTNCSALVAQDQSAIRSVEAKLRYWKNAENENDFYHRVANCTLIKKNFDDLYYVSDEERQFPLAFIIVVHSRPQQVYRLLKAIYRPHNLYCIHPDAKSDSDFIKMFLSISYCLDNVIVPAWLEEVVWGGSSVLDAQLNCMQEVIRHSLRWKYVINICGLELPLRTNREIVQALKPLNGSSAIVSYPLPEAVYQERFIYEFSATWTFRRKRLPSPPKGITIYKSMTYNALTRPFVTFLLDSHKARAFRRYLAMVQSAEEVFYASLYHLPEAPGGRATVPNSTLVPRVDDCIWVYREKRYLCSSRSFVRGVCIVRAVDLHSVYELGYRTHDFSMFFNKYYHEQDHVVMDCLEQRLVMQNRREYAEDHLLRE